MPVGRVFLVRLVRLHPEPPSSSQTRSRPFPSSRTPQTCPTRRVCGVRHVPAPSPCLEHHKHALWGMFVVSGTFALPPLVSNSTNTPCGRVCGVWHVPAPSPHLEHPKHALVG